MRGKRRRRHWVPAVALAAVMSVSGCGGAGGVGLTAGEGEFNFVSPGGKTRIVYPPGERQEVGDLAGGSVREPDTRISLSDHEGEAVLLNLWASWCGPCRAEADELERLAERTSEENVRFLGVNVRDDRDSARDFAHNLDVGYPSLYDPDGRVTLALRGLPLSTLPITLVLDRDHRVAAVFLGSVVGRDVMSVIEDVVREG
ncbi:TlpA family protein disulfide reductase [Actinopolyspora xinjiangensis]|nr:TlpA disulfide reductase family protein [Actinopolyspora xinjiangensis]